MTLQATGPSCTNTIHGGAVGVQTASVYMWSTRFENNMVTGASIARGGGASMSGSFTAYIYNTTFRANSVVANGTGGQYAAGGGLALFFDGTISAARVTMLSSVLTENSATIAGSAYTGETNNRVFARK